MTALAALSHAIRTTLVLVLVGLLAFGSLAVPASAAAGDHHSTANAIDGDHDLDSGTGADCPAKADAASHDMGDGSCCVGTCTTILGDMPVPDAFVVRIGTIVSADHPILARSRTVEFLRPPSLTI